MRIFLIPLSTRHTFLYAQRSPASTPQPNVSYLDRTTAFAARKWADWEKKESGWQRRVVDYGNQAFRRIPHEEWGLKSVPPLRQPTHDKIDLVFPPTVLAEGDLVRVVTGLATAREALHRKKLLWCLAGMPVTIPFALVPIIPNLPFFYLVYRAWSHWRAIAGGKHLKWLVQHELLRPTPSSVLDALYKSRRDLRVTQSQVRALAEDLQLPALEIELERAIWQVEQQAEADAASKKNS